MRHPGYNVIAKNLSSINGYNSDNIKTSIIFIESHVGNQIANTIFTTVISIHKMKYMKLNLFLFGRL